MTWIYLQANKENVAELMNGAGERVWYIINDLLNRQLISDGFNFIPFSQTTDKNTGITDTEDFEEDKDESMIQDETEGNQIIDNKQSLRKYFKYCDLKNHEEALQKDASSNIMLDDEDLEIILPWVDPDDWYKEYARVSKYIIKDIDSHGNVKQNQDEAKIRQSLVNLSPMDEVLERLENISKFTASVQQFLTSEDRRLLEGLVDYWEVANRKIHGFEAKLTSDMIPKLESSKQDPAQASMYSDELKTRTENVKNLIIQYDQISQKLEEVQKAYDAKSKEMFDHTKLDKLREAIRKIKLDLNEATVQEGMYRTELTKYQLKEKGDAFEMLNLLNNQDDQAHKDDSFDIN